MLSIYQYFILIGPPLLIQWKTNVITLLTLRIMRSSDYFININITNYEV